MAIMDRRRLSPPSYVLCLRSRSRHPSHEGAETRAAPIHNRSPRTSIHANFYKLISGIGSETGAPSNQPRLIKRIIS